MDDFIRREAAFEALSEYYHHRLEIQHIALREALNRVPTADVRPAVRGYWKPVRESEISGYDPALSGQDPIYMHRCSNCGIDSYLDENEEELLTAFCPMCGADMRGGK